MNWLASLLESEKMIDVFEAILILVIGFIVSKFVSRVAMQIINKVSKKQKNLIVRRSISFGLFTIFVMAALSQVGVDLKILLGAAGVFTVAIGFASQTSASNLISGLFIISEAPFVEGDVIKVGNTTGVVLSIDLMSTKLRTFDNVLVRIPNESIMKSEIQNMTHFAIRRIDLVFSVDYKSDLKRVNEVLSEITERNPNCLDEPEPLFFIDSFGDSAIAIQYSVWVKREKLREVKNTLMMDIQQEFERNGIDIPFPHRVIHIEQKEQV